VERKLTTILAADVVGYSRLMENDEAGTFDRLRAHRKQLFEPEIVKHHGRIFKLMGDGLLAEFGSVVDAVECAVTLQRGLAERNANVSDDQRIDVRIGINLSEVIIEGDDRLGEGVNIAARLQQVAEPGGICVSEKVAKEVGKKLAFTFEAIGERQVKNIAEAISVYKVLDRPTIIGPSTPHPSIARRAPRKRKSSAPNASRPTISMPMITIFAAWQVSTNGPRRPTLRL
jgi:adenylate cyclase